MAQWDPHSIDQAEIEHEVKVIDTDVEIIMKQLEYLWAEFVHEVDIKDRYYDTKDNVLEKNDQRVRIRQENDDVLITRKTKYNHETTKSMREDDTYFKSVKQAKKFLEKDLGLIYQRYKEKRRITYQLEDYLFDFDFYEWLPALMEVEGQNPQEVEHMIRRLWLQFEVQVKRGSRKLFKHYGKKYITKQKI